MKNLLFAIFLTAFLTGCQNDKDKAIGPGEWIEYRANIENNPVFESDDPLEFSGVLDTDAEIRATPVIADGKMFVGNHQSGDIQAFNLTNGELIWKGQAPNWIHSESIYKDGIVYVGYGNRNFKESGVRGTGKSGVLALNAENGKIKWKYETNGEVMPTPALYENKVYITAGDRKLHIINQKDGKSIDTVDLKGYVSMSSPTIDNHTLYVGTGHPYLFQAIDLKTNKIKWSTPYENVIAGLDDVPPVIYQDLVFTTALTGNPNTPTHMIYAMDKNTGAIIWESKLGSGEMVQNNKSGAPIIYGGKVYLTSPITKSFYAYNADDGTLIWKRKHDAVMKAPPVAKDEIVYFSDTKGRIVALDANNGNKMGDKKTGGKLAPSGPIIVDEKLIIGSQNSKVYVVPLNEIVKN